MSGEAWRATDLVKMVRTLQPDIIIDNVLEAPRAQNRRSTPEISLVLSRSFHLKALSMRKATPYLGKRVLLSTTIGYCATDRDYKSPKQVIRALAECVSNGNLC